VNTPTEATIEVSFAKVLILSAISMLCFVAGLFAIGVPMKDPLLVGFLIVMVPGMTFVFATFFFYMSRTKISNEGLRSAVPTLCQTIIHWDDILSMRRKTGGGMFYVVRGRGLLEICILPRPFFLKNPESLRQLIEKYAPADNIVRKELDC
jgi:hypothetical protein